MVSVSVRQITVATPSQFSLRTPFASTSCSARRHSANASRFDDMVKEIYALRGKKKSEAFQRNVGTAHANNGSSPGWLS
jgi:hypothetical protein